jgi:cobalt-precorrin 5A hydrolase
MNIVVGLGCDRGTPVATLETVLGKALSLVACEHKDIYLFATIDKKSDEVSINTLVKKHQKDIRYYSAAELARVEVPNPSAVVMKYMGTPAVSEAAAILGAETDMSDLLVEKLKYRGEDGKNATVSIVEVTDR